MKVVSTVDHVPDLRPVTLHAVVTSTAAVTEVVIVSVLYCMEISIRTLLDVLPHLSVADCAVVPHYFSFKPTTLSYNRFVIIAVTLQGGPAKLRPTYIFDGNI